MTSSALVGWVIPAAVLELKINAGRGSMKSKKGWS